MDKTAFLVVTFAALLVNCSVEGLRCFQGQRLLSNGREISNNLVSRECTDSSYICHRLFATALYQGASGTQILILIDCYLFSFRIFITLLDNLALDLYMSKLSFYCTFTQFTPTVIYLTFLFVFVYT